MKFDGVELPLTGADLIFPAILLGGFVISVSIGVWIWRTRWKEHQDLEKAEREGKAQK